MTKRKTLAAMIESCQIFAKHSERGLDSQANFNAFHDVIYGASTEKITPESEDGKRLSELGWLEQEDSWSWLT